MQDNIEQNEFDLLLEKTGKSVKKSDAYYRLNPHLSHKPPPRDSQVAVQQQLANYPHPTTLDPSRSVMTPDMIPPGALFGKSELGGMETGEDHAFIHLESGGGGLPLSRNAAWARAMPIQPICLS
jgi:hypothetical protein